MTSATASHIRLALAGDAMVLAADAANTVNSANSLEKKLAHQMAAAHRIAMKFLDKGAFS